MDMQCIRVNNLLRITERLNSLTFSTGTLVLPLLMAASHRVHAVEQNGETVSIGKYTSTPRTLRHRREGRQEMCLTRQGGT